MFRVLGSVGFFNCIDYARKAGFTLTPLSLCTEKADQDEALYTATALVDRNFFVPCNGNILEHVNPLQSGSFRNLWIQ